jgi:hypothetical protein
MGVVTQFGMTFDKNGKLIPMSKRDLQQKLFEGNMLIE